jgi:NDP-sugar pyrophosphorylase family protein
MSRPGNEGFLAGRRPGHEAAPDTDSTPKGLLRIGDRTLLDIWLHALATSLREVQVNLHHLAPVVRRHVATRSGAPAVRLVEEHKLLGSAARCWPTLTS